MAQIYCIYNDVNDKLYIGKTNLTYLERFKEHLRDHTRQRCEKRPLYDAMNKYGTNNFHVMLLEECTSDEASIFEQEWIEKLNTYGKTGYNATKGGDGKCYNDYSKVEELWNQGKTIIAISKELNICEDMIAVYIKNNNIATKGEIQKRIGISLRASYPISAYDKNTNKLIKSYANIWDAFEDLNLDTSKIKDGHVKQVIDGKRQSAYGYCWTSP